jgi:hypothetical protein
MGMNARQTGFTIRLRGRSLPTVTFMFRRAWCHESGPPRSREAFGSNPRSPTGRNLQILSHGVGAPPREYGRTGKALPCKSAESSDSKRVRRTASKSPGGTRDHSPSGTIGCNARKVRVTHAGVGSPAVARPTGRRGTTSGVLPKMQTVKSSTMRGASSPCQ